MRVYGSTRLTNGTRIGASAPVRGFAHGLSIFAFLMIMGVLIGIAAITPWIWVPLLILVVVGFPLGIIGHAVKTGQLTP